MFGDREKKLFEVGDIFEVLNGKGITKQEIQEHQGELPAIQSGEKNNGIMGYIDEEYCAQMNYTYSLEACLTPARQDMLRFSPGDAALGTQPRF